MVLADVAVVGGGPAGAAAATCLARAGRRVVLVDKARFPRDKICGDGLTTGALRLLEALGLRPAAVGSWQPVGQAVVRSPTGRQATFPLPSGQGTFAAVARRADLDAAVLDRARGAGVDVREGEALTGAVVDADRVRLQVEGTGEISARYAIGADGMWSPLRRCLGAAEAGYRGEWHAFRQYFSGVRGDAATRLHVWFEPDLLPGYAWSFPLPGGRANVGFGIQRGGRYSTQDMARVWPDLLGRDHVRAALGPDAHAESPHRAWPIPARIDRVEVSTGGGRALFVGDAAAATDPMTGEGIGQALLTGMRAAEAIDGAGPYAPAEAARRYTRAVRRDLVADHHMSVLLIRALRHRRGAEGAVRVADATDWTRRNFARWLFEDEPRAAALTPARWHRKFLARPGAYV